jgi:hypothetical protein
MNRQSFTKGNTGKLLARNPTVELHRLFKMFIMFLMLPIELHHSDAKWLEWICEGKSMKALEHCPNREDGYTTSHGI